MGPNAHSDSPANWPPAAAVVAATVHSSVAKKRENFFAVYKVIHDGYSVIQK